MFHLTYPSLLRLLPSFRELEDTVASAGSGEEDNEERGDHYAGAGKGATAA